MRRRLTQATRAVADSTPLLAAGTLLVFALYQGFAAWSEHLIETTKVTDGIPDGWFGIPADKLYEYLEGLGPEGRDAYARMNLLDLLVMVPSYAIVFGAWLHKESRAAGEDAGGEMARVFWLAALCDVVESSLLGYANARYPERLPGWLLTAASVGNRMKAASLAAGFVHLAKLVYRNGVAPDVVKRHRQRNRMN